MKAIQDQYDDGLITQEERHQAVTDKWNEATDEVGRGDDREHRGQPTS